MKNIIQFIREHKFTEAEDQIDNTVLLIMEKKLFEMKKAVAAKMCQEMDVSKEKSEMDDIEDKRKESGVNSSIKTNLGGEQEVASGKSDLRKKQTVNDTEKGDLKEEELDEARINLIRARVRGGKIQRRKRVSNVAGMTLRGGTLKRMSAAERRRRKMGARKGKAKRRAKLSRSLMKRKRSLQKRKSLGL